MVKLLPLFGLCFLFLACSEEKSPTATSSASAPAPTAAPGSSQPATGSQAVADPANKNTVLAGGTIALAPGKKAGAAKGLFVSLRSLAGRGPPIAALKLPAGPFPMKFKLTNANIIAMGGRARPVPAEFALKVTLDLDGDPMSKSPGDLSATQTVKKGQASVGVVLGGKK